MQQKSLPVNGLITAVKDELFRVKYKKQRIKLYESIWSTLLCYMKKRKIKLFNMKKGLDFLEDEYGITMFKQLKGSNKIKVRAINMLGEFQLHGIILSKMRTIGKEYYHVVEKAFNSFITSRRRYGISERTLISNELYLSRFSEYLSKQKLKNIADLNSIHILSFIDTLAGSSIATIYCTLGSIRILLRYLYEEKFLNKDFTNTVPNIKIDKTSRIPSAYSTTEVQKLLDSVDRVIPNIIRTHFTLFHEPT